MEDEEMLPTTHRTDKEYESAKSDVEKADKKRKEEEEKKVKKM